MPRQVYKDTGQQFAARGLDDQAPQADNYIDRLLKLIPSETIAMYLFLQGVLKSSELKEGLELNAWLWGLFIVLAFGNILYLRKYLGVKDTLQLSILTIAFVIWVTTLGGAFALLGGYKDFMGSVLLGLYTFFAPMFYTGKDVNVSA